VLRIGVAGAGNIASIAQLPTLVARDDVELRGLEQPRQEVTATTRRSGSIKPSTTPTSLPDQPCSRPLVST
jgi:virulence factor